jgi:hypothetical protein
VPFVIHQHYTHGFDSIQLWRPGRIRSTIKLWTHSVAATFCLLTYLNTGFVIHNQTSVLTRASVSVLDFSLWQACFICNHGLIPLFSFSLYEHLQYTSPRGFLLVRITMQEEVNDEPRADGRKNSYRVMTMDMIGRYSTRNSTRVNSPQHKQGKR